MRLCEVQAIANEEARRETDRTVWGHDRHECEVMRAFAQEHADPHRCACGFRWDHQPTDNDAPPDGQVAVVAGQPSLRCMTHNVEVRWPDATNCVAGANNPELCELVKGRWMPTGGRE